MSDKGLNFVTHDLARPVVVDHSIHCGEYWRLQRRSSGHCERASGDDVAVQQVLDTVDRRRRSMFERRCIDRTR